jgi:hypothetical protein
MKEKQEELNLPPITKTNRNVKANGRGKCWYRYGKRQVAGGLMIDWPTDDKEWYITGERFSKVGE